MITKLETTAEGYLGNHYKNDEIWDVLADAFETYLVDVRIDKD